MSPLLVLGALYLLTRAGGAGPAWPSPKSPPPPRPPPPPRLPPPPVPAQARQPTARKAPARKAAPKGAQRPAPPAPAPPPPEAPPPAARPSSAPLPPPTPIRPVPPAAPPQRLDREATVLEAQRMLNALGARLVPDGLYGPKTRGAWQTLSQRQGLVPDFVRTSPKTAAVSNDTYERIRTAAAAKGRGVVGVYIP